MKIINFNEGVTRRNQSIVAIGDWVTWVDYNDVVYTDRVKGLVYHPNARSSMPVQYMELCVKKDYSVIFDEGLSVYGSCIREKLVKLKKNKRK